METSNFAHVIFQNVGKSFLPQAALECHYTLTPFITPHPKDWVGIFKNNSYLQSLHTLCACRYRIAK
ncbi:tax1-binding protein 1-like A [Silurus meridionalis]|nr:tax1-binding protein 1-like A [Silurus meridionalis]